MGGGKEIVPASRTRSASLYKSGKSQCSSHQVVGYEKTKVLTASSSTKYVNRHGEKYACTSQVKVVERVKVVKVGSNNCSSRGKKVAHHHSASKKY